MTASPKSFLEEVYVTLLCPWDELVSLYLYLACLNLPSIPPLVAGFEQGCLHLSAANLMLCPAQSCLLRSSKCISTAPTRTNWWARAGAFLDCACCGAVHIAWWSLFASSFFVSLKPTFCDRCRGSEPFRFKV